jgi:hypothetical protein
MTKLRPPAPDPLASILNHPEGQPFHSTLSGLIGQSFNTYVELIKAEKSWGEKFGSSNRDKPSATRTPPSIADITPSDFM